MTSRWKLLPVLIAALAAENLAAEVLVYRWSVAGSEFYSPTGDDADRVSRKYAQNGFVVFEYQPTSDMYHNPKIIRYWKDPAKVKYYFDEDFLYGIGDFEKYADNKANQVDYYLAISAHWGGTLGEYYSGKLKSFSRNRTGLYRPVSIAPALKGWATWDKTYADGATSRGGGTVKLTYIPEWTLYANENKYSLEKTVTELLAEVADLGYTLRAQAATMNAPINGEANITGGTIDGATIGANNPKDGTFLRLQSGAKNKSGEFVLHSGPTGFDASIRTSDDMEDNTPLVLPPNNGSSGQVLTTDGSGTLSWTPKGSADISMANAGSSGCGVYDSQAGSKFFFRNIAAGSEKASVKLGKKTIAIDVDETKIDPTRLAVNALDRANHTGTQLASTISDFHAAVLKSPYLCKANPAATGAPTVNDDASKGYAAGSVWADLNAKTIYLCSSAAPGAAVWKELSVNMVGLLKASNNLSDLTDAAAARANLGIGDVQNVKNRFDAAAAPSAADDAAAGFSVGSVWVDASRNRTYVCVNNRAGKAAWQLTTAYLAGGDAAMTDGVYTNKNISAW